MVETLENCDTMEEKHIIELPKKEDRRGNLSFLEEGDQIPFKVARAYWIYDVPGGQTRGSHAFKHQEEMIIALSGSFDVILDDGKKETVYQLNRAYRAVYVPPMTWRTLDNFSTNSVCLVLSSSVYDEGDYIRNYKEFQKKKKDDILSGSYPHEIISTQEKKPEEQNTVFDCSLITLPVIRNRAGNITPVHNSADIPFDIKRVFYVYDIPSGETRGSHAHRFCHQLLVAASGSFEVDLDDGSNKRTVVLNNPMHALHVPPGVWATEKNYSSGTVCLVLASDKYSEADYIRTYSEFKKYRSND